MDILVFDMSQTPAVFLEWASATGVTQDLADNSTVSFSAVPVSYTHLSIDLVNNGDVEQQEKINSMRFIVFGSTPGGVRLDGRCV